MTSFVQRAIDLQITLGEGNFGEGGANQVTVSGHRVSCGIVKAGGASLGGAQIVVYGLSQTVMNRLSTLGMPLSFTRRNTVSIRAGNVGDPLTEVYLGTITNAFFDASNMPTASFNIQCFVSAFDAVKPQAAASYNGVVDVATVLGQLAAKCDPALTLENNGINTRITNPYLPGSAIAQIRSVCKAANINYVIDKGILAIWPKYQARGGDTIEVSPATGMQGYPSFTGQGIILKTLFNPAIEFGRKLKVVSSLQPATKQAWTVYKLTYELDAQVPHGRWDCEIEAASSDYLQSTSGVLPS